MPIRHKLPQWAILIVTLVSCAGTPSKPETSAPDTVQLTFAWPTIDGSVRRTHVEQSDANPAEETAVTYTVTATREASAVEVAYTDPREVDIPGLAPEELEAVRVMFEATPVLTLQDGRVTAISNGDGLREILDELGVCSTLRPCPCF